MCLAYSTYFLFCLICLIHILSTWDEHIKELRLSFTLIQQYDVWSVVGCLAVYSDGSVSVYFMSIRLYNVFWNISIIWCHRIASNGLSKDFLI